MSEPTPNRPQEAVTNPANPELVSEPRVAPVPEKPNDLGEQAPVIYRSEELLQGRRHVFIEHGNDMYRLRLTASGKLYLTK